ncbi:AzlC family protein [Spiribacter salinus M19-40]|uniref:AzlC family protein n=1 Tax=Spiribacter salinus M19-40 TaxID=1260251 RepID=R4VHN6_9GAMM|nr:AzlC family ABC transporter permease [Spiribacter salinus]AGM41686.1 AzlC family protein [Spiribacter salinus M19-40]MDR9413582.1 AzlC family ABC transporter permease [Spiribacter sp.]MDR9455352.1 AzlC family ABC transporter permease [Spiribacter sp.]
MPQRRAAFATGLKAVAPMVAAISPFGVTAGVAGLDAGIGFELTMGFSLIVFAGASQLAALQLIDAGAASVLVIVTALLINLRMLMYSAHLGPHLAHLPLRWRTPMAYLLTDQAYALTISRVMGNEPPPSSHWFYLGAALPLWVFWQLSTAFGYWAGTAVPPSWELGFIVPLVFLALLVPAVRSRPAAVAALVAGTLSVLGQGLPAGLGLTLGASAGIIAGVLAEAWWRDD